MNRRSFFRLLPFLPAGLAAAAKVRAAEVARPGVMTEEEWNSHLEKLFRQHSNRSPCYTLYCGPQLKAELENLSLVA